MASDSGWRKEAPTNHEIVDLKMRAWLFTGTIARKKYPGGSGSIVDLAPTVEIEIPILMCTTWPPLEVFAMVPGDPFIHYERRHLSGEWSPCLSPSPIPAPVGALLDGLVIVACPDCKRPRVDGEYRGLVSSPIDDRTMPDTHCWRESGRYGERIALTHCLRGQVTELTTQLAEAKCYGAQADQKIAALQALPEDVRRASESVAQSVKNARDGLPVPTQAFLERALVLARHLLRK